MNAPDEFESHYKVSTVMKPCERCKSKDFLYLDYPFWKPVPGVGLMEFVGEICGICRTELHKRNYTASA